jgi:hypothetical protein
MIRPMPDDQRPDDAPSLEAPSLGRLFGRRKGRAADQPGPDTSGTDQPGPDTSSAAAPGTDPSPAAAPQAAPQATTPPPEPAEPVADTEQTVVLDPTPAAAPARSGTAPEPAAAPAPAPVATAPTPTPSSAAEPPRAPLSIDGRVAAGVTGLVVGLLVVLLTAGSLRLCESVRGVSTCGGGPGFVLLVAVMVAMVLLGGTLLRLARVPDPMSTSFLAVGLTCVLSLLFLVDVLDEWWMVIVIPVITVSTFLLSHWVTTSVIEPAEG